MTEEQPGGRGQAEGGRRWRRGLGFGDDATVGPDLAGRATEAATNLARHATGGELVFRSVHDEVDPGFEMLAIDRGPGMADLAHSQRDGHSTSGTPGQGLGAIARLSQTFDAFTNRPGGTVILSRVTPAAGSGRARLAVGVVCLPVAGEVACGDSWAVDPLADGRTRVVVADGLGHGLRAADASRLAVRVFRDRPQLGPADMVDAIHAGLRGTRGAAVAVVELPAGTGTAQFAGVGNVVATLVGDGTSRGLVSHNGTAGVEARRVQAFAYPWAAGHLLLMHSDGLASQWQLSKYPGLRFHHPSVIAAVLYRDFRRVRDDVTVLAVGGARP